MPRRLSSDSAHQATATAHPSKSAAPSSLKNVRTGRAGSAPGSGFRSPIRCPARCGSNRYNILRPGNNSDLDIPAGRPSSDNRAEYIRSASSDSPDRIPIERHRRSRFAGVSGPIRSAARRKLLSLTTRRRQIKGIGASCCPVGLRSENRIIEARHKQSPGQTLGENMEVDLAREKIAAR
jgi:hypothetical protein